VTLLIGRVPATQANIYQDGNLIESLDLKAVSTPFSFTVESGNGVNIIAVEPGRIRVSAANCPDGSCVRQGWISDGLLPVVCLPHRLIIRLEGGDPPETELDAVVG
jgi:hypothetical protein